MRKHEQSVCESESDAKDLKTHKIEKSLRQKLCLVLRVQTHSISGGDSKEVPPVPMPNTEVKLLNVDDTWWVTARESRKLPELTWREDNGQITPLSFVFKYIPL